MDISKMLTPKAFRNGSDKLSFLKFDKKASPACHITPSKIRLSTIFQITKTPTIGVDIGHEWLRMVKVMRSSDGKGQLIDKMSVEIPEALAKKSQEYSSFLKMELTKFIGPGGKGKIWTNIPTANVDVHYIRIPKVSPDQIDNAIYWTARKETAFDEKEHILEYEIQGAVLDQGVNKLSVMVCTAPRIEVEEQHKLFIEAGFPLSGITIIPFALQNLLRTMWLDPQQGSIAMLFIGNDFSRIDIFSQGNMVMTRGIKAGTNSMVESLQEQLSERGGAHLHDKKGDVSVTIDQARTIFNSLSANDPLDDQLIEPFGVTGSEIFSMALPALSRLIQQVERTFEYYEKNSGYGKVDKLYISSVINTYSPLVDHIGDQLAIEREIINPFDKTKTPQSFIGQDTIFELNTYTPALGLALSDKDYTPNFIFTSQDKQKKAAGIKTNRLILSGFVLAYLFCASIYYYQEHQFNISRREQGRMERELAQFHPRLDQAKIIKMAAAQRNANQKIERYLSVGVIGELSSLTPTDIRLLSIKANFNEPIKPTMSGNSNKATKAEASQLSPIEETLEVEGMIRGSESVLESLLAQYIMKLRTSPLFGEISIVKNTIEPFRKGTALLFTLQVKLPKLDS